MKHRSPIVHIYMLVSAVVVIVAAIGLYDFMYHLTGSMTDAATSSREEVIVQNQDQSEADVITSLYRSTAVDRSSIHGLFIRTGDAVTLIKAIESVGTVSGASVKISSISDGQAENSVEPVTGQINAVVSVDGSWSALIRSLKLLEALPYQSSIGHVSIGTSVVSGGKADSQRKWQMTLDLVAPTL